MTKVRIYDIIYFINCSLEGIAMPKLYPGHTGFDYHAEKLRVAREKQRTYPCDRHLSQVARLESIFEESGICIPKLPPS